jgi:hypothetical protein
VKKGKRGISRQTRWDSKRFQEGRKGKKREGGRKERRKNNQFTLRFLKILYGPPNLLSCCSLVCMSFSMFQMKMNSILCSRKFRILKS